LHYLYILRCADRSLYVGETPDLAARLRKHQEGGSPHTAKRRPVALVYSETFENRIFALGRERQVKRWTRVKKEALIAGDLIALKKH
jgi:predicted GIY-YIG superfamily endonuclease